MWFVVIGTLLTALKALDVPFLANVSWLWVLSPFVLAIVWWSWADSSGYTKRRQIDKMEAKKAERRRKQLDQLGMGPRDKRR